MRAISCCWPFRSKFSNNHMDFFTSERRRGSTRMGYLKATIFGAINFKAYIIGCYTIFCSGWPCAGLFVDAFAFASQSVTGSVRFPRSEHHESEKP